MNNTSCILTVIKNEQEYLDEWIKYHLNLGIKHIFIFEDVDSESHKNICDKYGDNVSLASILTIMNDEDTKKTYELKLTRKWNVQHIHLRNGLRYIKENFSDIYDWCFVIDNDEFITFENEDTKLEDIFSLFERYDGFIMQWKCYGANGYINKPDYGNNGLIGTYTQEMTGHVPDTLDSFIKACHHIKTYNNSFFFNQHHPSDKSNWVNTDFKKDLYTPCYNHIYLRHYITKSWEEYVWKRKVRGFTWDNRRSFDFFFEINQDMKPLKEELMNKLKQEQLVILTYKQNGSQGNELRLALSGWRKFCQFPYHFVIIGTFNESLKNEFPWVEFIYCPQIDKKEEQYNQHLDVIHCMEIVKKKYDKIYDGFIWTPDDNYAIKPFSLKDITDIHYHAMNITGDEKSPTSYWSHDKWKTGQLLRKEKLPCLNYTTHYPCYFNFSKLNEIWNKFNMRNESYVLEDIYFNYFEHDAPILDNNIRLGIWNKFIFEHEFQKAVQNPNIKFICNSDEGWSRELEADLDNIIR